MDPEIQSKLFRWGAVYGGAILMSLNHKLGLNLDMGELAAIATLIATGVSGSNWKEAHAVGKDAEIKIAGVKDAAAVLGSTPAEYKP